MTMAFTTGYGGFSTLVGTPPNTLVLLPGGGSYD